MSKAENRHAIIQISDVAMGQREINLNSLLDCARRELEFRQRVYRKWVEKGTMKEEKAAAEIELMRTLCDFLRHCVFKAVVRGGKSHDGG